jgi:broad specificity phosphatase PhoE
MQGPLAPHPSTAAAIAVRTGKKTIAFMRHGESVANADGSDEPDPPLTELGRRQAAGRRACVRSLGVDVCICSPLLRAMETAALAFEHEGNVAIEVCRYAREKWWFYGQCRGCAPAARLSFAAALPRAITGLEGLHEDEFWDPERERKLSKRELGRRSHRALEKLIQTLQCHAADTIAVVCHYGVIQQLTSVDTDNCDIVVCELTEVGFTRDFGPFFALLRRRCARAAPSWKPPSFAVLPPLLPPPSLPPPRAFSLLHLPLMQAGSLRLVSHHSISSSARD